MTGEGLSFFSNLSTPRAQIENREPKGENYLLEVDNPLVVPAGKKVRVLLTANDVIHAWWVPALGVKQDAIPGFIRDVWFNVDKPGTYRGQCAELCGKEHEFPVSAAAIPRLVIKCRSQRPRGLIDTQAIRAITKVRGTQILLQIVAKETARADRGGENHRVFKKLVFGFRSMERTWEMNSRISEGICVISRSKILVWRDLSYCTL